MSSLQSWCHKWRELGSAHPFPSPHTQFPSSFKAGSQVLCEETVIGDMNYRIIELEFGLERTLTDHLVQQSPSAMGRDIFN